MKISLPLIHKKSIIGGFLFCLLYLFFFVVPALAIETQSFSAYPTHSSDTDPRSKSWFIYSLSAGDQKTDSVTIVNNETQAMTLKVYPADSLTTNDGNFALANEDALKSSLGAWVTLTPSTITLGPKEKKNIPFTISIPANMAKGEYSGGIIFQNTTPQKISNKGMGINVISRIGVRIYESVPGPEQLNMEVRDLNYTVENNYLTFNFIMENKGTVHISPKGTLEVKDMFGRVIEIVPLENFLETTVPGKPVSVTVPTKILSPMLGWNTVNVAIYYSPTKAAVASITFMPNPWSAYILILAAIIVVLLVSRKYLIHKKSKHLK